MKVLTRLAKMAEVRIDFSSHYYAEDYWKGLENGDVAHTKKFYQTIVDRLIELSDDDLHTNFFGRTFEDVSQLPKDHISVVPDDFKRVKSEFSQRASTLMLTRFDIDDYKPFGKNLTAKSFETLPNELDDESLSNVEIPSNIDEIDRNILEDTYEEDFLGISSAESDQIWPEAEQEATEKEARIAAEKLLTEETKRVEGELLLQKNLALLEVDLAAHEEEDRLIRNWLDTRVINVVSEDGKELVSGDAGKIVCTFNKVTKEFSLVFGKNKCRSLPAKLTDLGKYFSSDPWKTSV